jgi:primosomal protein N'
MPAVLEKIRTPHGVEFTVTCEGETPQENYVLGEKLKQNSIELPKVELDFSLENYIKNFEQALPKHLKWRVRNQVVFGVFPSARMAMYHDLETSKWDFGSSEVINTLFAGTENSVVAKPFADDYEVDDPKVESKVPFLITEADSSQFSTLVDLVNSKNLAVEGPPGSGKSQTIVNSIAAALYEGKKVLFVAEKSAALEVVKSRLEALHLGEFILPLLAAKSNRSGLIESLRERLDHGGYNYEDIKSKKSLYSRYRNQINR